MEIESLCKWAQLKGLTVIGTGDFTHPKWFSNLKDKLEEAEPGLFNPFDASYMQRIEAIDFSGFTHS